MESSYREYSDGSPWPITICPPSLPTFSKLSVVIAFYKHGDMTAGCVESILRDIPNAEIILVNNGSDLECREIISRRLGDRVAVIDFEINRGRAVAWNTGLRRASGALLATMNNEMIAHEGGIPIIRRPEYLT